jgi:hypothetical protein
MEDTHHWYIVRDGKIFFYKLDVTGLPLALGPDQSAGYDLTNMVSIDKSPIFDNLRNYVVAFAIQKVPDGQGTKIDQVPTWPLIEARTKNTIPDVPWAKALVKVYPGQLDQAELATICDNVDKAASVFELTGKQTISGNANIKPYDQWGDLVIYSVTHNVDLGSKIWTTDLEFMKKGV